MQAFLLVIWRIVLILNIFIFQKETFRDIELKFALQLYTPSASLKTNLQHCIAIPQREEKWLLIFDIFCNLLKNFVTFKISYDRYRNDFATAWMNLGIVLSALKKYDESEQSYETALLHRPVCPDCYYNLGVSVKTSSYPYEKN